MKNLLRIPQTMNLLMMFSTKICVSLISSKQVVQKKIRLQILERSDPFLYFDLVLIIAGLSLLLVPWWGCCNVVMFDDDLCKSFHIYILVGS